MDATSRVRRPVVLLVPADENDGVGDARGSKLASTLKIMLKINGIFDMAIMRRPRLGEHTIQGPRLQGLLELQHDGLVQERGREIDKVYDEGAGGEVGLNGQGCVGGGRGLVRIGYNIIKSIKKNLGFRSYPWEVLVPFGTDQIRDDDERAVRIGDQGIEEPANRLDTANPSGLVFFGFVPAKALHNFQDITRV
jgi:hypothetical protein